MSNFNTTFPIDGGGDPVLVNQGGASNNSFGTGFVNTPAGGVTGTWASTEAADTFLASSAPSGTWGSTEAPDVFNWAGHPSLFGSWASTEAADVFSGAAHPPAPPPSFVTVGAIKSQAFGTTIQPALPASLVNGNFLIAFVGNGATAGKTFTFPAGWTAGDAGANGNLGFAWAYRFVDGTETDPIISWTGNTSAQAQIWQFSGVITVGASNKTVDTTGFTTAYAASALTTTGANSLVMLIEYNNNGRTVSPSPPTDYTAIANVGPISSYYQDVTAVGDHSTAVSSTLSGTARVLTAEIELTSVIPPNFAAWASTEAKDVFAGIAGLLGGSWHSTETADIFSGAGYVPATATMAPTEHADIMDFEVFIPPFGTWASTEAKDAFAGAGSPTAPLGLDAHATGGAGNNTTATFTSATVNITTTYNHDVIVLGIYTGGFWAQGDVTSITDTAGLFWQKRIKRDIIANHLNGTRDSYFEEWWAHKPTPGATTITVNTNPTGAIAIDAFAIVGANYNGPFDTNTGSGWLADNFGGAVLPGPLNHFGNPNALVYTDAAKVFSLAFHISDDQNPDTSVPAGLTFDSRVTFAEHNGNSLFLASAHRIFNTQQFGTTDTWFGPDGTHISDRVLYLENIVGADQSGTDDVVRWFFDGTGNRTIEQFGVGQNTTSMNFVTYRADTIGICAVLIQSNLGTRVASISDTLGNSPGWERRSIVTDTSGAISLEIWWTKLNAPMGPNGQITIHTDGSTTAGDTVSAVVFGLHGPDVFNRGEIWDGNGSLPATNHGNSTGGHQTVGPFSSGNDRVFVLAMGANIDTTENNTSLDNGNNLPYLFMQAPAEVDSDGPPSYHIGMQFKFNADVVNNATAEFDLSPAPQSWLMIADILPVGPVSPPHGSLAVTEATDFTGNNGAFTAIGLDAHGWVGYVPATATMAPTEPHDTTSNNGGYEPLFDGHGFVGWVPAFATWADTDAKDTFHAEGWVLGPTTILGRMAAGEAPDRFNAAGPHTNYDSRYSKGDRTGLITVTTNASLDQGTVDNLVDGAKSTNNAADAIVVSTVQPVAMFFKFDFGTPIFINEAKWYQNGSSAQPGLWVWEVSDDDAAWTLETVTPFVLDGGNIGSVIGDLSGVKTPWRYYRLRQTTAAGGQSLPWLREIEFKVDGITATMQAVEDKDRFAGNALVIPIAHPIPPRKRRMLILS